VDPPNGILPDWQVVCEVSNRMGFPMTYHHPSEIMDEIAQLTPMLRGVSYDRLDQHAGLQWPVSSPSHDGTSLMHDQTFPKGKARFVAVEYLPPGETASEEYPFILTTGRVLQHYNCGAQTRRTDILEVVDTDVLEMHATDMERLHLSDGAIVRLVSLRGQALLPAIRSERVLPGHLFTSFHFPASTVNELLSSSADESSKCPEYKVSAVRVEPIRAEELDSEDEAELRHMRRQLIL
jgi:formate dehydrogenase major subunit